MLESKADEIRDLLAKGMTVAQAAKATGAHYSHVHGIAKKLAGGSAAVVNKQPTVKKAKVGGIPQADILAAGERAAPTKKLEAHAGTPWAQLPDEIKDKAYEMIEKRNNSPKIDKAIEAEYWIDVTGKYHVFYTLWRYRTDKGAQEFAFVIKNPVYLGNLSTDLLAAVEKACNKVRENVRIVLMTDENRTKIQGKAERFKFGKYRGELFTDVFLQDPGYFMFLAKNSNPKYGADPKICAFADMAKQEITEKNRETSKSQYLGEAGAKVTVTGTVYNIKEQEEPYFGPRYGRPSRGVWGENVKMMKIYRLEDSEGNKFIVNRLDKVFPEIDIQKGTSLTFSATIKNTFEAMGIKFTSLTRPKLPK